MWPFLVLAGLSLFYVLTVCSFIKLYKEQAHQMRRQRSADTVLIQGLIDRLMHKEGVTWTPPPRPVEGEEVIPEELQKRLEGWREV